MYFLIRGQQLLSKVFAMHIDLSHHRFHAIHHRGEIRHGDAAAKLQLGSGRAEALLKMANLTPTKIALDRCAS